MIKSISIENFKGLKKVELHDLYRVTLLGGKNNVGKSSLLEAAFLLCNAYNHDLFYRQYALRHVEGVITGDIEEWGDWFYGLDLDKELKVTAIGSDGGAHALVCKFNKEYAPKSSPIARGINDIMIGHSAKGYVPVMPQPGIVQSSRLGNGALEVSYTQLGQVVYEASISANGAEIKRNSREKEKLPPALIVTARDRTDLNTQALSSLDINNRVSDVLAFLKLIEPGIKSISVIQKSAQAEIYADIGLSRKIPLKLLGDGVIQALAYYLAIANTENGIVFIDEIENGMHHSVHRATWQHIFKAVKLFNCQVFATTHSYGCVQAAYEAASQENEEVFSYVRLDKIKGEVIPKHYSREQLGMALKQDWEVR